MKYYSLLIGLILTCITSVYAQVRPANPPTGRSADKELDSLRKREEEKLDTVIFTAKYIRYTTVGLLKDSTRTVFLDTLLTHFHHYNPLISPERPTINLGNIGQPAREMLFNPRKTIGFDPGFHSLDFYRLNQDSIRYYRARTPFTSLYYVNGTSREQIFRVTHSQNIKPNWNFGANYFRVNNEGFYLNQNTSNLNASVFTWYEGPKKRYNLLVNGLFNTLKNAENGSVVDENIFEEKEDNGISSTVRLGGNPPVRNVWKQKEYFIKQFYYIGRLDTVKTADSVIASVRPTQRFSHQFTYANDAYTFDKPIAGAQSVFPSMVADTLAFKDSTTVKRISNEFRYSFYLRGRSLSFVKNELKLDVGLQHDLYKYQQLPLDREGFQNVTLKGDLGYRFSDRVYVNGSINQITVGRNAGDYLYEAQSEIQLSKSVGRVIIGAYIQNKSPEALYERSTYFYHNWNESFDNTKINNLSFTYLNPKYNFRAKAEYFLMSKYLYYERSDSSSLQIKPMQADNLINMLKITGRKDFHFGRFNLESYLVLQKSDFQDLLQTPEIYTFHSFYYKRRFSPSVAAHAGFDLRWNSQYNAPSYAINVSQFYVGNDVRFSSYPIVDVWGEFALKRANIFLRYDYANQGLLSKGYYTVNRYPMPGSLLRFGVQWNFYD
ncbi:putative porin [Desertivirga arenae]|uniref:putative porin n=1 Tax=Desertivirga arenae TaxID=2810309 RepID=UPI001A972587|nr:putative porin [Pedobacter sp. SYSU D00823]